MRSKWLVVVVCVLLLVGCTMVSARSREKAPTAVPTSAVNLQPTSELPASPQEVGYGDAQHVVERAIADLQMRLEIGAASVTVQEVLPIEFSDASLGVPEPGVVYAQVLTPGYVIHLTVDGQAYTYHGSGEQVMLVPGEMPPVGDPPSQMPPLSGDNTYHSIDIADTGLSFEIPDGWLRLDPEWAWTPAQGSEMVLGVNWVDVQPPTEPEAVLLPNHAQTLYSEEVMLAWGQGRRFLLEVYAPAAQGGNEKAAVESVEIHVLTTVRQGEMYRAFDLYVRGGGMEDMGTLDPLLQRVLDSSAIAGVGPQTPLLEGFTVVGSVPDTGWTMLRDDTYGYEMAIPADWTWKECPAHVAGMPDDWPTMRMVLLYPQAWDAEINRSGPPDPNAKPVIAPLQVEVVVGPPEQFRRVYPEPMQTETIEINGLTVTVEKDIYDTMTLIRYVFVSPESPEVYVTLSDQMTGFPDRVSGNEAIAELVPAIVTSCEFGQ